MHFTLKLPFRLYAGVVTIAGGKWSRGGGHVDGPSEDAKFSNDFDLVYISSSCSLLVVDRGNQAIREIQLNEDDCTYQNDGNLHLGKTRLVHKLGILFWGQDYGNSLRHFPWLQG